jgi:hypothetical protein
METDFILSAIALLSFLALIAAWVAVPHTNAQAPVAEASPVPA